MPKQKPPPYNEGVESLKQYWYDIWDEIKPEMCGMCDFRIECLGKEQLRDDDAIHCIRAYQKWARRPRSAARVYHG